MARIQRALAQCTDMTARRNAVFAALNLRTAERVLEVGCGGGFYAYEAAQFVGPEGAVRAIDISEDQIKSAQERCADVPWVKCKVGDAVSLAYEDAEFDAIYGVQVLEYLPDIKRALQEFQRVLRPGGRIVILATNWTSLVWNSRQPDRMRKALAGWRKHAPESDLPAILASMLREVGLRLIHQVSVPVLNTSYNPSTLSYWAARLIRGYLVASKAMSETEATSWLDEFDDLEREGAYFFSVTPVLTQAMKVK